jgi:hypothetical protein
MRYISFDRRRQRLGLALLLVISMLALFAAVALAFVFYAEAEAVASQLTSQTQNKTQPDTDAETLLAYFLSQLIYDTTNVNSAIRGHSLARTMYGSNPNALNFAAYAGIGRLHYSNPALGADDFYFPNYQYYPNDSYTSGKTTVGFIRDPEFYFDANRTTPSSPLNGANYRAGNAPYTYPDLNSIFLARVDADGSVVTQSYYRPWLTAYATSLLPAAAVPTSTKYCMLTPDTAYYHTNWSVPDTDAGGNVRNLDFSPGTKIAGGGYANNDSWWLDLGWPVMIAPNGKKYKALFAPLVLDLDNRINMWLAGNTRSNGLAGGGTHVSSKGFGPSEINPTVVSPSTGAPLMSAADLKTLLSIRYGGTAAAPNPAAYDAPPPQWPQRDGPIYGRIDFDAYNGGPLSLPTMVLPNPNNTSYTTPPYYIFPDYPNGTYPPAAKPPPNWLTPPWFGPIASNPLFPDELLQNNLGYNIFTPLATITLGGNTTGTTYTLSFQGQTTGAIAADYTLPTTLAQLQSALAGLSTIGANNVVVTQATGSNTYTVSLTGRLAGQSLNGIALASASAGLTVTIVANRALPPASNMEAILRYMGTSSTGVTSGYFSSLPSTFGNSANPLAVWKGRGLFTSHSWNLDRITAAPYFQYNPTASTKVDPSSAGTMLPATGGAINVLSTTGFPISGIISINFGGGVQTTVTYNGITATSFQNCMGGVGKLMGGELVMPANFQYGPNGYPVLLGGPLQSPSFASPNVAPVGEFTASYNSTLVQRLRVNLNRFTNGQYDFTNKIWQYDYPIPDATGFIDRTAAYATVPAWGTAKPWTYGNQYDYAQSFRADNTNRVGLAYDIYNILVLVTGAQDPNAPANAGMVVNSPQYQAARWLAQLAVNIVDYIDNDDISTPFKWDGVNGDWVFGTETPRLVINEAYTQIDNPWDPVNMVPLDAGIAPGGVLIADSTKWAATTYSVNAWVELHNTFKNSSSPTAETYPFDGGVARLGVTPSNMGVPSYAAYQIVLSQPDSANLRGPNNNLGSLSSGKPLSTVNTWGTGGAVMTVKPANGAFSDPTAVPPGTSLANNGFFVVGPPAGIFPPATVGTVTVGPTTRDPMLPVTYNTAQMSANVGTASAMTTIAMASDGMALPQMTINVASTTGFPTSGIIVINPGASQMVVSYTGTTATSFTNCSTNSIGTMALGQAVVPAAQVGPTPFNTTILLRRLACPYLPPQPVATNPLYNPYITVDYVENVTTWDNRYVLDTGVIGALPLPAEGNYFALGRKQPYSAAAMMPQQPTMTTIGSTSNGQALPGAMGAAITINVASTAGFPAGGGSFYVVIGGKLTPVTYTATTATTFTGCASASTSTLATGQPVILAPLNPASATIDAKSNGAALPAGGTIVVNSTAGFPPFGNIYINIGGTQTLVSYANTTATTFTGCTSASTSVLATGQVVTSAEPWNTFFQHNSFTAYPTAASPMLTLPFDWLTHLDRPVVNGLEVLHVSGFRPHELTQQFILMNGSKFQHYAPWTDQTAMIFRALELIGVPSYLNGATMGGARSGQDQYQHCQRFGDFPRPVRRAERAQQFQQRHHAGRRRDHIWQSARVAHTGGNARSDGRAVQGFRHRLGRFRGRRSAVSERQRTPRHPAAIFSWHHDAGLLYPVGCESADAPVPAGRATAEDCQQHHDDEPRLWRVAHGRLLRGAGHRSEHWGSDRPAQVAIRNRPGPGSADSPPNVRDRRSVRAHDLPPDPRDHKRHVRSWNEHVDSDAAVQRPEPERRRHLHPGGDAEQRNRIGGGAGHRHALDVYRDVQLDRQRRGLCDDARQPRAAAELQPTQRPQCGLALFDHSVTAAADSGVRAAGERRMKGDRTDVPQGVFCKISPLAAISW